MTINEILKAANEHYPDGQLEMYWDFEKQELIEDPVGGDTLAQFIVVELSEASEGDPEEAIRLLERAKEDIEQAIEGIQDHIRLVALHKEFAKIKS